MAPAIVHDVLRGPGTPLDEGTRHAMEGRLGADLGSVRVHTDDRAAASARAVSALAYTVGRSIVFDRGGYAPQTGPGRTLLAHELVHTIQQGDGPEPGRGALRIEAPDSASELEAQRIAAAPSGDDARPAPQALARAPAPARLSGVTVNHQYITVPPASGLSVKATAVPAGVAGVTFGIAEKTVTPAPGTAADARTGAITIDNAQPGGELKVTADTAVDGVDVPLHVIERPATIVSTTATPVSSTGMYGGRFIHTFAGNGPVAALQYAQIDERFDALTVQTVFGGKFSLTTNPPGTAGWTLDAKGTMSPTDNVTIEQVIIDARPFVKNASNPRPAGLPAGFAMTQHLHAKAQPSGTLDAQPFTDTDHVRNLETRANDLEVVIKAGKGEVVQSYVGPGACRNAKATPASIAASAPRRAQGGPGAVWIRNEVKVTADVFPTTATARFVYAIASADLGCEIDASTGVVKVGSNAGKVTVRVSDSADKSARYDEVTFEITAATAKPTPGTPVTPAPIAPTSVDATGAGGVPAGGPVATAPLRTAPRVLARTPAPTPTPAPTSEHPRAVVTGETQRDVPAGEAEQRRVADLRRAWAAALDTDWDGAAAVLNAFSIDDIDAMLKPLTTAQRDALRAGAIRHLPGYHRRIVERIRRAQGVSAGGLYGKVESSSFAISRQPGLTDAWQVTLRLGFAPDPAVAQATKIGFIQTVRIVDLPGGRPNDPIAGHAARSTPSGTTIDRPGGENAGVYGLQNDGTLARDNTFGSSPAPLVAARFLDRPTSQSGSTRWDYELAVVALEGVDAGVVYARIDWGFRIVDLGEGNLVPDVRPVRVDDKPTAEFLDAAARWNDQARGPSPSGPRQQALPDLR